MARDSVGFAAGTDMPTLPKALALIRSLVAPALCGHLLHDIDIHISLPHTFRASTYHY
jgi:hypothetical protein